MSDYKILTLKEVNCNCSELSFEEFAKLMIDGFNEAVENHLTIGKQMLAEYNKSKAEKYIKKHKEMLPEQIEKWTKYAQSTWVTEKRRKRYIDEKTEEWMTPHDYKWSEFDGIRFFDINVEPGSMGIHEFYIFRASKRSPEYLKETYDNIINNKYFKVATGWRYKTEVGENGRSCFRPYIEMIVREDVQNEIEEADASLSRAVADFYKDTKYFGD